MLGIEADEAVGRGPEGFEAVAGAGAALFRLPKGFPILRGGEGDDARFGGGDFDLALLPIGLPLLLSLPMFVL